MTTLLDVRVDSVRIPSGRVFLEADLTRPESATGLVIFAHGSGSSRKSPRNRAVASALQEAGFATLLLDLLTIAEEREDVVTANYRFDIGLLAARLISAIDWSRQAAEVVGLPIGLFGASTGAAAALVAAAERGNSVRAVVSRGGRPDLAWDELPRVAAPTLLIVGRLDAPVIKLNQAAADRMRCTHELVLVPGATHLFEEAGALDKVSAHAARWFAHYLVA
jgi:dienelactone hydrolase